MSGAPALQLWIVTPLASTRNLVEAPLDDLTVDALYARVAAQLGFHRDRLRLVRDGRPVASDADAAALRAGDTLLAVSAPRPPPQELRDAVVRAAHGQGAASTAAASDDDDDDEALRRLLLPASAPAWQRRAVAALGRAGVPRPLASAPFRAGGRFWGGLAAWAAASRGAAALGLGPLYLIGTVFALIAANLGTRAPGSVSAYSIFNRGLERLPGQLDAAHLDRQVRGGQFG